MPLPIADTAEMRSPPKMPRMPRPPKSAVMSAAPTPMPPADTAEMRQKAARKPEDFGVVMVEEPLKNRMCIALEPAACAEEMYLLRIHGFRWSPPFCVWMRRSGPKATYASQKLIPELTRIRSEL